MRIGPRLTVSLGLRDELSTGWNEAHGRAANYTYPERCYCQPALRLEVIEFTVNNARFLPQPQSRACVESFRQLEHDSVASRLRNVSMTCRTRSVIGRIRTRPSIPPIAFRIFRWLQLSDTPGRSRSRNREASTRRRPARSANAYPDLMVVPILSSELRDEHCTERRLRRLTRLSRDYRDRFERAVSGYMPAGSLPCQLSKQLSRRHTPIRRFPRVHIMSRPPREPIPTLANTWTYFSEGDTSYQALQVDMNHRLEQRAQPYEVSIPGQRLSTTAIL